MLLNYKWDFPHYRQNPTLYVLLHEGKNLLAYFTQACADQLLITAPREKCSLHLLSSKQCAPATFT